LKLNLHPRGKESIPNIWNRLPDEMVSVERPSMLPRLQERIIASAVSLTTILAGMCIVFSSVTFFLRLVQHAAAFLR
jgi:hypothetical protein